MKLSQIRFSSAQHIIVYGDPKTGKTRLLGSLAAKYKLLWIDIENGLITLTQLPTELQDNIEVVQLPDTRAYPIAATTLLALIKGQKTWVCAAHGAVNCPICQKATPKEKEENSQAWHLISLNELNPDEWIVVLDGITQLGNSVMAHICREKADDYKPDWDDFRVQGALLDRFFSQVQQARFNFVCTALVVMTEREDGTHKLSPMCGTTNYSTNVGKYFDHVVYCEMKGKKHAFGSATTYSLTATSGSRTGVAIEEQKTDYPTMLPFFEAARRDAALAGTGGSNQAGNVIAGASVALNSLTKGALPLKKL